MHHTLAPQPVNTHQTKCNTGCWRCAGYTCLSTSLKQIVRVALSYLYNTARFVPGRSALPEFAACKEIIPYDREAW